MTIAVKIASSTAVPTATTAASPTAAPATPFAAFLGGNADAAAADAAPGGEPGPRVGFSLVPGGAGQKRTQQADTLADGVLVERPVVPPPAGGELVERPVDMPKGEQGELVERPVETPKLKEGELVERPVASPPAGGELVERPVEMPKGKDGQLVERPVILPADGGLVERPVEAPKTKDGELVERPVLLALPTDGMLVERPVKMPTDGDGALVERPVEPPKDGLVAERPVRRPGVFDDRLIERRLDIPKPAPQVTADATATDATAKPVPAAGAAASLAATLGDASLDLSALTMLRGQVKLAGDPATTPTTAEAPLDEAAAALPKPAADAATAARGATAPNQPTTTGNPAATALAGAAAGERGPSRNAGVSAAAASFAERIASVAAADAGTDAAEVPSQPTLPSLPATAAPAGHTATTAGAAMPHAVPMEQLGRTIAARAAVGETRFEIRLDPAELGRVDVSLEIDNEGNTRAHIAVERRETLDMMMRDQRVLERALRDAGLSTGDGGLSFSMRGDQGGREGRFAGQGGDGAPASSRAAEPPAEEVRVATQAAGVYGRAGAGRIDIRI